MAREIEVLERVKCEMGLVVRRKEREIKEKCEMPTIHKGVTCQILSDKPST